MASTRSIINLEDDRHPNLALSKLNNESPFFKALPLEVRLMIYEFAVHVDRPIVPVQVERHANKFIQDPRFGPQEFTTVPLAQTCRAIYAELEKWHPFYKVNMFTFFTHQNCLSYLAGITPQRREQLRWIVFEVDGYRIDPLTRPMLDGWQQIPMVPNLPDDMILDKNLLAMLSQCDSLHSHRIGVRLDFRGYKTSDVEDFLEKFLRRIRDPVRLRGQFPLWDLPSFGYELFLNGPEFGSRRFVGLWNAINYALDMHRESIRDDVLLGFEEMAKNNSLREAAVAASEIQFPGELRIALNKENSTIGPVASRTRAKCRAPNSTGIVERKIPRYDQEGHLINVAKINNLRWDDTGAGVQCEVVDSRGRKDWESLDVVLDERHESKIRTFYSQLLGSVTVDKLKAIPPPQHIIDIAEVTWSPEQFCGKHDKKTTLAMWRTLAGLWDSALDVAK